MDLAAGRATVTLTEPISRVRRGAGRLAELAAASEEKRALLKPLPKSYRADSRAPYALEETLVGVIVGVAALAGAVWVALRVGGWA